MKSKVNILILSMINVIALFCTSNSQQLESTMKVVPYFDYGFFYWIENNEDGINLVEEDGILYNFGSCITVRFGDNKLFYSEVDGKVYFGTVDYDGLIQYDWGIEPYKSETDYFGARILLNFGYLFIVSNSFKLTPEVGIGFEHWLRELDKGGQYGYDETYNMIYGTIGIKPELYFSKSANLFLKLLAVIPISIEESIDFPRIDPHLTDEINVSPGSNIGILAELGSKIYGIYFSLYLDAMLFSKSNVVKGIHQPESERSIYGIKLGYAF